jgi:excisionase family DNA binding protein
MPEPVDRLAYSPAEVAAALGCTRQHVTNLIAAGVVPSLKLGRRRLIRRDALEAVLAELEREQTR